MHYIIIKMNNFTFLSQRLHEFNINQLIKFREEHYSNYILNKRIIDKCIKDELNENDDKNIYINSYIKNSLIGTLRITQMGPDVGFSGLYIKKDFRNSVMNNNKLSYLFFPKAFSTIENTWGYTPTPNLVKINIAKNAPKHISDMYQLLGFEYTKTFFTLDKLIIYNAENDYNNFKFRVNKLLL